MSIYILLFSLLFGTDISMSVSFRNSSDPFFLKATISQINSNFSFNNELYDLLREDEIQPLTAPSLPDPIIFYGETHFVESMLEEVSIVAERPIYCGRGCGCPSHYIQVVEEITSYLPKVDSTLLPEPIYHNPYKIDAKIYPNPTQNRATLSFEVEHEEQFEINLLNSNGQLVQIIHKGFLSEGFHRAEIDLEDQNSGLYFIQIISVDHQEVLKLSRVN